MGKFFISYSRTDKEFVLRLKEALEIAGHLCWLDLQSIPPLSVWEHEIHAGIEGADNFIFVISPDSVVSDACESELVYALSLNKRIVPIVCRRTSNKIVPKVLSPTQWVFLREDDDFDKNLSALLVELEKDSVWRELHTELLVKALTWEHNYRRPSLLLKDAALAQAIEWLKNADNHAEKPVWQQIQFIRESGNMQLGGSSTLSFPPTSVDHDAQPRLASTFSDFTDLITFGAKPRLQPDFSGVVKEYLITLFREFKKYDDVANIIKLNTVPGKMGGVGQLSRRKSLQRLAAYMTAEKKSRNHQPALQFDSIKNEAVKAASYNGETFGTPLVGSYNPVPVYNDAIASYV